MKNRWAFIGEVIDYYLVNNLPQAFPHLKLTALNQIKRCGIESHLKIECYSLNTKEIRLKPAVEIG